MAGNIKREYVVDASFILSFFLPDENNKDVSYLFKSYAKGEINFISSFLLPYEVLNGFRTAIKRGRLLKNKAIELVKDFIKLKIPLEDLDLYQVFILSLEKNLTLYDATYAYLAKIKSLPLLTLDKNLSKFSI